MVRISEDLIRRRAEHNNCEIATLEELSLHQSDIERIEFIDKWCRDLKILYLQSNLIPRIENVSKLKKLEYLNLALNNVLVVENLEGCESLTKLDLTVNFIGKLTSIETLRGNEFLRELYLTGNPCTEYVGYRDYVIASLPQLSSLDGTMISKSERIQALQYLAESRCDILRQQARYLEKLQREQEAEENSKDRDVKDMTEEEFWSKPSKFTPEGRLEAHRFMEEKRKEKEDSKTSTLNPDLNPIKRTIRFFNDEGRPLNINQDKMDFVFTESEDFSEYLLDVSCYKYLDTSLIDVDIQPLYVRVTMKEKVLQLALTEEVCPDKSAAQRSQTSGHLMITMPKLKYILDEKIIKKIGLKKNATNKPKILDSIQNTGIEKLEVCENKSKVDYKNIVNEEEGEEKMKKRPFIFTGKKKRDCELKEKTDEEFIDDLDVPPLE